MNIFLEVAKMQIINKIYNWNLFQRNFSKKNNKMICNIKVKCNLFNGHIFKL